MHTANETLGSYLDAFLLGNVGWYAAYKEPKLIIDLKEPDLYERHAKRGTNYTELDYIEVRLCFSMRRDMPALNALYW